MWAATKGHIEVVRELLKRGAKKELKDNIGRTAYDQGYMNTAEIKALLSAGGSGGGFFSRMFG